MEDVTPAKAGVQAGTRYCAIAGRAGDAIGANATVTVKRTDFNMGKYAPNVGDEVTIDIAVEAIKE